MNCTRCPTLEAQLAEARFEADDFRAAWAILDEPNSGLRIHTGETAADVARAFVDSRSTALAQLAEARATANAYAGAAAKHLRERDEARRDVQTLMHGAIDGTRALRDERDRLRKLFDDAGQGEHNVLALVDHYQDGLMRAERERDCYRAARLTWPPHVLEAVERGDVEACRADAKRRHDNWTALEAERDEARRDLMRVHDALHRECDGKADLPAEIRALRAELERVNLALVMAQANDERADLKVELERVKAERDELMQQRDAAVERYGSMESDRNVHSVRRAVTERALAEAVAARDRAEARAARLREALGESANAHRYAWSMFDAICASDTTTDRRHARKEAQEAEAAARSVLASTDAECAAWLDRRGAK